jgi:hypothetical protein
MADTFGLKLASRAKRNSETPCGRSTIPAPPAVLVFAHFLYASKHQFPQLARLPGDWEETATNSEEPGELPLLRVTPAAPV